MFLISLFIKTMSKCLNLSLASLHNDEFLLWGGPSEHNLCVIPQDVVHLFLRQVLQVRAMNHTSFGIPEYE